jgi:hypothetical protein
VGKSSLIYHGNTWLTHVKPSLALVNSFLTHVKPVLALANPLLIHANPHLVKESWLLDGVKAFMGDGNDV